MDNLWMQDSLAERLEQIYAGYGQQVAALENVVDLLPVMDSKQPYMTSEPGNRNTLRQWRANTQRDHTAHKEETVDEEEIK